MKGLAGMMIFQDEQKIANVSPRLFTYNAVAELFLSENYDFENYTHGSILLESASI